MKSLKLFVLGLAAAGLLTGCPKEAEEPKEEPKTEEPKQEEPKEEEPKEEEPKEEEKAEVNKELFIKAAYEVTCVRAKIEDTETQKGILAEIYPRYEFTEESFTAAEVSLKDETTIQEAIKSKMEACTPEIAAAFKTAGADAEKAEGEKEGETAEKAEKKPAKKSYAGNYDGSVGGGGFTDGKINVTVKADNSVFAKFQGKREGKKFIIPMKGNLTKDGSFTMHGKKGTNRVKAEGKVNKGTAGGRLSGSINKKPFNVTFNAKM